jgi:diguanylate cyclase (GGDEF)-like protein
MSAKLFSNHILALLDVINAYGLGLWEMEDNVINLDPKTGELIGLEGSGTLTLDDFLRLVDEGDKQDLLDALDRVQKNPGQDDCVECRVQYKNEGCRWLRIMGKSYLNRGKLLIMGTSQLIEGKALEYLNAKISAMAGELDKKTRIHQCIFEVTEALLNADDSVFEQNFQASLELIARTFDLARVYLYKNHLVEGILCCTQIHEWVNGVEPALGEDFTKDMPFHSLPGLEEALETGKSYNRLVTDIPQELREMLPREITVILLVPVFLKDMFWGFVGFERAASERIFDDNEVSVISSAALLLANSVIRYDLNKNLYMAVDKINTTSIRAEVLEKFAYTDALTGLYNRRHFMELAQTALEKAKRFNAPCYAMILDLDFFKKVNDTYGHLAGDEVLKNASAVMKNTLRAYDLLARYGGEEFVVLVSDTGKDDVLHLADRMRESIAATPCIHDCIKIFCSVSIGVAESFPDCTVTSLIEKADKALYTAKESGRNRVVFNGD